MIAEGSELGVFQHIGVNDEINDLNIYVYVYVYVYICVCDYSYFQYF